uniref:Uncharacterized protein n=1 Tax=Opuntia streptacantha TaxID=393608 RepID=A0A7C8YPE3_OPUST
MFPKHPCDTAHMLAEKEREAERGSAPRIRGRLIYLSVLVQSLQAGAQDRSQIFVWVSVMTDVCPFLLLEVGLPPTACTMNYEIIIPVFRAQKYLPFYFLNI